LEPASTTQTASANSARLVVGIAAMEVSDDPSAMLVTYALGSCIAVTVYDPVTHIGGMLHLMLPQSSQSPEKAKTNPCMFADLGIPMLFKSAYELGAKKERLVVAAAGGAEILADGGHFKIGSRNRTMLRKLFWKNNILLAAEDTGGTQSRTMTLRLSDGYTAVKSKNEERALWPN